MREILFRGRRIDNGEWIMGSLCVAENHTYIVYDMDFYVTQARTGSTLMSDRFYEVDPATVGQFTGLSDKYDCWIFEGDVLKGDDYPFTSEGEVNYFAQMVWVDNSPAFGLYTFKNPESKVRGISEGNTEYIEDFESDKWEVISTIHDEVSP